MSELQLIDIQDVMARAASALAGMSGSMVTLDKVQPLSNDQRRHFIARASAIYADGGTRSVIVKATRSPTYDPAAEDAIENSGLVREWVAMACIAARVPDRGHGCALLGGDVAHGLLVLEDLGADLGSLVDPLLEGTTEEAEHALKLYATALARLHADMAGCLDQHHDMYEGIFRAGRPRRPPGWRVEEDADHIVSRIGGALPSSELALLSSRLSAPGSWLSLIHGDPCPDNALKVGDGIRLIDYEFARPSHALLDGIYWRIGFPSCWCAGRVPTDVAARVDAVYRAEVGKVMPLALNDAAYRTELAYMSAIWLFTSLSWRLDEALEHDTNWGTWSVRGRLLWYLDAVIEMTADAGVLPGINKLAAGWLSELRFRWPDAIPLGLYPAFVTKPDDGSSSDCMIPSGRPVG